MQRSDRDKLIEDNINLVYFTMNKYYPTYIHDEDLIQCGMIGLCNAANKFDDSKGSFSTYAVHSIRNEIRTEFRNRQRQVNLDTVSLDTPIRMEGETVATLGDAITGQDDVGFVDLEGFYKSLTDGERKYFDLLKEGYSQRELHKILGCSKQSVSQMVRRLKAKWRVFNGN